MLKFKIGDTVKVTAGKDKGREAQIERLDTDKQTAVLPGVNIYKRHIKPALAVDKKGGVYDIPRPLSFAKIALICPHCKKQTRVGFRMEGDTKMRICKKCDRAIDLNKTVKKATKKK